MTGWKLEPEGIKAVLQSVNVEADGLNTDLVGTPEVPVDHGGAIFEGLSWASGLTGSVMQAVSDGLVSQAASMTVISNRIAAGQLGVVNATNSYLQGDNDMAAGFQGAMSSAADGDFSFFEEYGVS